MGNLVSCCCKGEEEEMLSHPLHRNMHCFLCGEWFNSPIEYNKHIPTCNKGKNT